jgi:hypothetical protein
VNSTDFTLAGDVPEPGTPTPARVQSVEFTD